ncbi:MAG: hypothetical protein ACI4UU_02525 [Clostridia bacterium]
MHILTIIVSFLVVFWTIMYIVAAMYYIIHEKNETVSFMTRTIISGIICILLTVLIIILAIQKEKVYIHLIFLVLWILSTICDAKTTARLVNSNISDDLEVEME